MTTQKCTGMLIETHCPNCGEGRAIVNRREKLTMCPICKSDQIIVLPWFKPAPISLIRKETE